MELVKHEIMKSSKKIRSPVIGTPVLVRLQPLPLEAVDEWRRRQAEMPSRAEAIRRLIEQALGGKKPK